MQGKSRLELYRELIAFIEKEAQQERLRVNRRMFSVFVWCFIVPTVVAILFTTGIRMNLIETRWRPIVEWLILVFPVSYSIYYLGSEVLTEVPHIFRRGGMSATLNNTLKEGEWRYRTSEAMKRAVGGTAHDWSWMATNFRQDLKAMRDRARYLTALAGAVFFLILEGIDFLGTDTVPPQKLTPWFVMSWLETAGSQLSQLVALALFLVLLYLAASQTAHALERYLNCADLIAHDMTGKLLHGRRESDR